MTHLFHPAVPNGSPSRGATLDAYGPYPNECELTYKMPPDQVSKLIGQELARAPKP
jgi:hypothetical protein